MDTQADHMILAALAVIAFLLFFVCAYLARIADRVRDVQQEVRNLRIDRAHPFDHRI